MSAQERLREVVRDLISKGTVDCFIGFERGSTEGTSRPLFIRSKGDVNRLIWDKSCRDNLVRYLREISGKVGILVKGCDGLALAHLIEENQLERGSVYIVAIECGGIETKASQYAKPAGSKFADHCLRCRSNISPVYDVLIETGERPPEANTIVEADPIDWAEEFQRCVRCLACIKACPMCYCTECSLDGSKPWLVSKLRMHDELVTFHLVRALHMVGRCSECGACEMACPVKIPLTKLYSSINRKVESELGGVIRYARYTAESPTLTKQERTQRVYGE